jgi:putative pyruvate formate lyase activating enzyme
MNCHLYGSKSFYELADPITDVWLPDLRYGNDECAKSLSGVEHYMEQAETSLNAICRKGNNVIVRILVLPGHVSCCHEPTLRLLSRYKEFIRVSVLEQYIPEYKALLDPVMSRRPTSEEIKHVNDLVRKSGLRDISDNDAEFWVTSRI